MNGRGDVAEGISANGENNKTSIDHVPRTRISANGTIKPELAQTDETSVGNDKRQTLSLIHI